MRIGSYRLMLECLFIFFSLLYYYCYCSVVHIGPNDVRAMPMIKYFCLLSASAETEREKENVHFIIACTVRMRIAHSIQDTPLFPQFSRLVFI